jgi:hypothetical protein
VKKVPKTTDVLGFTTSMTGERRDESVSVSLRELEKLENERQDREKRQREAHAVAMQRTRDEAAKKEREALAAKERAEAEERERVRLREVEEEARREAMSRAAVEQARIGVEAKTRAEEADRERRHELELARVRAESKNQSGAGVVVGSGLVGFAIAIAVCCGVYFGAVRPANARTIATLENDIADANAKTRELRSDSIEQSKRIADMQTKLDAANNEIASLKNASKAPATQPRGGTFRAPTGSRLPASPTTGFGNVCAGPGDPACGQ